MKHLILTLAAILALGSMTAFSQVQFKKSITITSGTFSQIVEVCVSGDGPGGTLTDNTVGVDVGTGFGIYEEAQLPPLPPSYDFDARLVTLPGQVSTYPTGLGTGVIKDVRGFVSAVQVDSFRVSVNGDYVANNGITISWPNDLSQFGSAWIIKPLGGSAFPQTDMLTNTSITVPAQFGPISFLVIKTGATAPSPGPTFSASPSPVNFGSLSVGNTLTANLVISNTGGSNPMTINALDVSRFGVPFSFVVTPTFPVTINAGNSVTWQIAFAPTVGGTFIDTLEVSHDATGSPSIIEVRGTGVAQGGTLEFASSTRTRSDLTSGYVDSLLLTNYVGTPVRAIQLRIINAGGKTRLSSVQRGPRIADAAKWMFQTEIGHGPVQSDLSSIDTIKVVILGTNDSLSAATTSNLLTFTYSVVDISTDSATTHMMISDVLGSAWNGSSVNLMAGVNQVITILDRGVALKGDPSGDGSVDILDLLAIIDHILGRSTLVGSSFMRADVAPWPAGDGLVNASDLAQLQWMILNGTYPDNTPIPFTSTGSSLSKGDANEVNLIFDVVNDRVTMRLESAEPVKGVQCDILGLDHAAASAGIFDQVQTNSQNGIVRSLAYSQSGSAFSGSVDAATFKGIVNGSSFSVRNVVVSNQKNEKMKTRVSVNALGTPSDFTLHQNYPNPFNPSTTIVFSTVRETSVHLEITTTVGTVVRSYEMGVNAGDHSIVWDGRDASGAPVPSGMYLYRLSADGYSTAKTMTLSK